jgi:hypothetical protein
VVAWLTAGEQVDRAGAGVDQTHLELPFSPVFSRAGVALRDADDGFMVADERLLSVLVLVMELNREPGSCLVIVGRPRKQTDRPYQRMRADLVRQRAVRPCLTAN